MIPCSTASRTAALLLWSASLSALAEPAGILDPSFDGDGKQTIAFNLTGTGDTGANYDRAQALVAAPGGRFYLAGSVNTGPLMDPYIAHSAVGLSRLRFDGTLDVDFGEQGMLVHELMPNGSVHVAHAALQRDGKLLIAGWVNDGVDGFVRAMACRFTSKGARDAAFGDMETPGCRFFLAKPGRFDSVLALDNGDILLGGTDSKYDSDSNYVTNRGWIVRLDADGQDVAGFGEAGNVLLGADDERWSIFAMAHTQSGQLLATGIAHTALPGGNNTFVLRLDATTGVPDPAFGPGGARIVGVNAGSTPDRDDDAGMGVHELTDGSILITGSTATDFSSTSSFSARPFAMRLLQNGELDQQFGGGIRVYNPCPILVFDCAIDAAESGSSLVFADGRFVIAGSYRYSATSGNFFAMRLLPDGEPDLQFGPQIVDQAATSLVDFALVKKQFSLDGASAVVADGERLVLAGSASTPPLGDSTAPDLDFAAARLDHGFDQTYFNVSNAVIGKGALSPDAQQSVNHSDHVDFNLTPAQGYRIDKVEGCDGALYGKIYTTGPIVADCTVTATFELKPIPLFSDQFEQ